MNPLQNTRYKPRISFKGMLPFYLISEFFLVVGMAFMFGVIPIQNPETISWFIFQNWPSGLLMGAVITAFSVIFLTGLTVNTLALGSFYEIQSSNLLIKMGLFKKIIPLIEIVNSKIIHEKDLENTLKDYQKAVYERTSARDVWGALKSQFQLGDLIRYCTVPVVFSETKLGGKFTPSDLSTVLKYGANTSGDFVLITLANGKKHILSPVELDKFLGQLS
jgi:hypothetical protein